MLRKFIGLQNVGRRFLAFSAFKTSQGKKERKYEKYGYAHVTAGALLSLSVMCNTNADDEDEKAKKLGPKESSFFYRSLNDFLSDAMPLAIGIIYDEKNAMHREYLRQIKHNMNRLKYEFPQMHMCKVMSKKDLNRKIFEILVPVIEDLGVENLPKVYLKSGGCLYEMKPSQLDQKFGESTIEWLKGKIDLERITSAQHFSDCLARYNKKLDDCVVVFYCPKEKNQLKHFLNDQLNKKAINILRHECGRVLYVDDKELGEKLKLEQNVFYCYYKPSFVNGFEDYVSRDFNMDYLQALEGVCRDEFRINKEFFDNDLPSISKEYYGIWIPDFLEIIFDHCFKRTFDVEFWIETNLSKKMKYLDSATSPIVFVHVSEMLIKMQPSVLNDLKMVVNMFNDSFDFVLMTDSKKASQYFYMKEMPEIFPFVAVVDPSKKTEVPLKAPGERDNFYYFTVKKNINPSKFTSDLKKFLNKVITKELGTHEYQSQKLPHSTYVKSICQDNFEEEILKNNTFDQCIIEVHKHHCGSCMFNGKIFNIFSRKLQKHGLLKKLPCFRLDIDNKVPYLGNFFYSPIYYLIKKKDGKIVEMHILDPPQKSDEFVEKISSLAGINLSKIKIDPSSQFMKYARKEDLEENFDIDFDVPIINAKASAAQQKKSDKDKKEAAAKVEKQENVEKKADEVLDGEG